MRHRADRGFTLIEVLVALAVASGALVLVLSATSAGFRRGTEARVEDRIRRAAQSKFAEWRIGSEKSTEGRLPGFESYRWEIVQSSERLSSVKALRRATLRVFAEGGAPVLELATLRFVGEGSP